MGVLAKQPFLVVSSIWGGYPVVVQTGTLKYLNIYANWCCPVLVRPTQSLKGN